MVLVWNIKVSQRRQIRLMLRVDILKFTEQLHEVEQFLCWELALSEIKIVKGGVVSGSIFFFFVEI